MSKQCILPFFIPMEGCPHRCIYCDQVTISGHDNSPDSSEIREALDKFSPDPNAELAFYGGSFTCLPRERQLYYLEAAQDALSRGRIGGIRISTRPDAVDKETCDFLRSQGVVTVELGIQSFNDKVLQASLRGYDSSAALAGCWAVAESGLRLGVQLMTGLPGDNREYDLASVDMAAKTGARLLRIYPTLVLEHTPLAALYRRGKYYPQELPEAVDTAAAMCMLAHNYHMTLIRVGLNPSAEVEAALVAGPYHPAFGGLVRESIRQGQLRELLSGMDNQDTAVLYFAKSELPLITGYKRQAAEKLAASYPNLLLSADPLLPPGTLRLFANGTVTENTEYDYCQKMAAIKR